LLGCCGSGTSIEIGNQARPSSTSATIVMARTGGYPPAGFERQNAAGMSSYLRRNEDVVLSGGLSYGVEAKQFGGRAGMLFAWQGNRVRAVE
jgi:hypothetical protein